MIAFTLALAFGWALAHPAPTLLATGVAAAFAVLALAAWYGDRPERHPGRHVLADPDAETITVIHRMHEELHHEDPFGAAYLTAPPADMGPGAVTSTHVDSPAPADVPGRDGKRPDTPATAASGGQHCATAHATVIAGPGHPAGDPAPEDVPGRAVAPVPAGDDPAAAVERPGRDQLPPPPDPDDDQPDDPALDLAPLAYEPWHTMWDLLSDDTITRGMPAVAALGAGRPL